MTFCYLVIRKDATELILSDIKQMFNVTMYCTYPSAAGYCI